MSESLAFAFITYSVHGQATQAKASAQPSARPSSPARSRRPSAIRPTTQSRSKVIAAACAAGTSASQTPSQPKSCSNGT